MTTKRDRTYYATLPTNQVSRIFRDAEDRSQRADTSEAYLADAFVMQEAAAVLNERRAPIPDSPEPARFGGSC